MLMSLPDIDVPVISAINGPATIHSELCVLADIVLAADTAKFRDSHIGQDVVPGDGCHAVRNLLLARAWTLAATLAAKSMPTLRYSRMLFAQTVKESMLRELSFGLALAGLCVSARAASGK